MSETTQTAAPEGQATPVAPAAPEEVVGPGQEPSGHESATDDLSKLRSEAANYRRKLRDAEAERDQLREQVDRRDRADAERLAGQTMAAGSDLWTAGVELADLRGDDGALEPELVEQAVGRVLSERPHWRKQRAPSFDGGARTTPATDAPSFGKALKAGGR